MSYQFNGLLGSALQTQQMIDQSPQHQVGNVPKPGSQGGGSQPRGGQSSSGTAGNSARNSSEVGASDSVADNNAGASPPPVSDTPKLSGSQSCPKCPKKFPPRLALWSQLEGSGGLGKFAPSDVVDPDGTPILIYSGEPGGSGFYGICVDSGYVGEAKFSRGGLVFAQLLRDSGNTHWEKMRLTHLKLDEPDPFHMEAELDFTPLYPGLGETFINADASFVLIVLPDSHKLFRRKGDQFSQVTFSGANELRGVSLSQLGPVVLPAYSREENYYAAIHPFDGYPAVFTPGTGAETDGEMIKCWNALASDDTAVGMAWKKDLALELTSVNPVVNSMGYMKLPCSRDGRVFAAWVSGRPVLPYTTPTNQTMLLGYKEFHGGYPEAVEPWPLRQDLSSSVEGCVVGVDSTTGATLWKHSIVVEASHALEPEGILSPLTDWLPTQIDPITTVNTTIWHGRYSNGEVDNGQIGALGKNLSWLVPFTSNPNPSLKVFADSVYPNYDVFVDASIVLLPRETPNNTRYRDVGGYANNLAVFTDYAAANSLGDTPQGGRESGIVADEYGNVYLSYLEPKQMLVAGGSIFIYGSPAGFFYRGTETTAWALLEIIQNTAPGAPGVPAEWTSGHLPDMVNVHHRKIRKIGPSGELLAEADLTQLHSVSWYETEDNMGGLSSTVIGGTSDASIPLADNVWLIAPCGRVVFVFLDYHDQGPNLQPATKLEIRSAADLSLLHAIELRTNDDTVPSSVYRRYFNEVIGVGDGVETSFTPPHPLNNAIAGAADGIPISVSTGFGTIDFATPPPADSVVTATYESTEVDYDAGERQYLVDGKGLDIRTGLGSAGEWALVWIQEEDLTTRAVTARTLLIQMDVDDVTLAPSLTTSSSVPDRATSTIVDGSILTTLNYGSFQAIMDNEP